MQTEHRSTLVRKDREIQHLQKELESTQQQCETLKRMAAPLRRASEDKTASGPQRRVLLEQNSTAEKTAAVAKPTAMTSTIMPQMNRYVCCSECCACRMHFIDQLCGMLTMYCTY